MNKLTILLRREIWENKSSFIYLPIVVASLCAFFVISGIGALQIGGDLVNIDADINYKSNQITETYNVDDTFDSLVGRGLQDFSRQPEIAKRNALNGVYLDIRPANTDLEACHHFLSRYEPVPGSKRPKYSVLEIDAGFGFYDRVVKSHYSVDYCTGYISCLLYGAPPCALVGEHVKCLGLRRAHLVDPVGTGGNYYPLA